MTSPLDVFDAELNRRTVTIAEQTIDLAELRDSSIAMKHWPRPVTGQGVARLLKFLVKWEARALTFSKRASRDAPVDGETVLRILRGDVSAPRNTEVLTVLAA